MSSMLYAQTSGNFRAIALDAGLFRKVSWVSRCFRWHGPSILKSKEKPIHTFRKRYETAHVEAPEALLRIGWAAHHPQLNLRAIVNASLRDGWKNGLRLENASLEAQTSPRLFEMSLLTPAGAKKNAARISPGRVGVSSVLLVLEWLNNPCRPCRRRRGRRASEPAFPSRGGR